MRKRGIVALAVVAAATAAVAATVGSAGTARTAQPAKSCAFNLRIGDVLPFTGGLAAYGANLDRAVKVAVGLENAALKQDGLARPIKVTLVGSEDGQTQASASVEAATKLVKSNHANVIIGEMASSATIPMAQSVDDPEPHRPDLADLERAADHRHRRQRLPLAHVPLRHAAGQGARGRR